MPSGDPGLAAAVVAAAARHHGILDREQLHRLGVSDARIRSWRRALRLHRLHAGVYAVGLPPATREARWYAATLALAPHALVSHLTAAGLLGLRPAGDGVIHLSCPTSRRAPGGSIVHRARRPDPRPLVREGIPCTSVARTLADLAAMDAREAERAWRVADAQRLIVPGELRRECVPGRKGAALLGALLERHLAHGTPRTREEFEDRAADLFRPPRMAMPDVNVEVWAEGRRYRADLLWRGARVIVELDSWTWHGTPEAHGRDAQRSLDLELAGWTVVNLTWFDVVHQGVRTLERVARLVEARTGRPVRPAG